jgi:hypothetical protein
MGMNNSFYLYNDSIFTSQKRYRDDYYSFSPNMSIGGLKPITPMYANTPILPGYFMFNNLTNNGSTSNTNTPKLKIEKSSETIGNDLSTIKSDSINSPIPPDKAKLDCSNIVMVPSAGNNLGFYTWVINGSPYPNQLNNIGVMPGNNVMKDAGKVKIKKKKYKDELSDY